jgi:hypothetical protein
MDQIGVGPLMDLFASISPMYSLIQATALLDPSLSCTPKMKILGRKQIAGTKFRRGRHARISKRCMLECSNDATLGHPIPDGD